MKLHAERIDALNTVTAYGSGFVEINGLRHEGALIIQPEGEILPWSATGLDSLTEADFVALVPLKPEVVLFGSGPSHRFPNPRLTAALTRTGIGVEVMATAAACRTYNILMGEGRRVLAAVLPL